MSRTLLIIDDAMIIREMIKDTVTEAGWTVVGEAENGQQAVELYDALRPDAVTLDMVMPDYDGMHAMVGICELDPAAKILVVSAVDQKEMLKAAIRAGATDFVVKPFDRKHLVETLDAMAPENSG
jgi:two-component system chemotaxis response regulator CheY